MSSSNANPEPGTATVEPLRLRLPSPVEEIHDERLAARDVRLLLKRDDLINPDVPGNKWRKLQHNLSAAQREGHATLLTFGGAYSNHIRATAAAGHHLGLSTIGVVRGEEHTPLNPSLQAAVDYGMRLHYMDRETYRHKHEPEVIDQLRDKFGAFYLVPEGGSNALAVRGCVDIPKEIDEPFDVICCAVGTGGTLAGIAAGLTEGQRALGFAALKGASFLIPDVRRLQEATYGRVVGNWSIDLDHHFGGYAKRRPELDAFIDDFADRHAIWLDWVYVAKMMSGVYDHVEHGSILPGSTVVAVITGEVPPVARTPAVRSLGGV
ncbi:1-aminocyclopropane-1-carboxylate deaminase [Actinomadura sp. NBRC 104412]|uniref:1-aminocyclopropane-1-carboxylate deaminase/D-cysteine desulfhydrase n=1 Tax=Actinomadura sp. NBRC 104412 TaxID=3032203 RepID=UPI0024A56FCB|nr:pyridoxal-phosphate dependent enzyme [Actinomadura sp. NBRC 104412]GLZ09687.1 1-aminocyclopropane-1-carboxylate deaminase [Actinomadura sp. NBRC 104412]